MLMSETVIQKESTALFVSRKLIPKGTVPVFVSEQLIPKGQIPVLVSDASERRNDYVCSSKRFQ